VYHEEEGDGLGDVTAQANDMAIDEMGEGEGEEGDEDFGNDSEMLG
jgi:hypothetical protein